MTSLRIMATGPAAQFSLHFTVASALLHDGFGLRLLREAGLLLAIVTGRRSGIVEQRAAELGIGLVLQGVHRLMPASSAPHRMSA